MKKERHPIDDFFRKELDNFQIPPTEEAKESFLRDAEEVAKKSPLRWWPLGFSLFIIIVISGAILLSGSHGNKTAHTAIIKNSRDESQAVIQPKQAERSTMHNVPQPGNTSSIAAPYKEHKRSLMAAPERTSYHKAPAEVTNQINLAELTGMGQDKAEPAVITDSVVMIQPIVVKSDSADIVNPPASEKKTRQAAQREWRLGAGISCSPEWMFGTLEEPTFVNSFAIEGMFRFGRYSVRTGAGISISKGFNQLQIEYNDYLGSYMNLDSMTFAWDERHYYIVPTYWLTNKDMYDSLMKVEDARIMKRYTYLQIPVILGYDFITREKLSFGVRLGPVMSVLLKEKTLSDPYEPGKKQIISINEITPGQLSLNWQILLGMNATFRISRTLGIEVEPFAKYYFNSVHEKTSGSGKPWSVGVRAAFFISFQ